MCTIMKRLMIISLFVAAALCVSAQSRADRILSEMSSTLKSMGSYEVAFAVNADGYREVLGAAEGMKEDKASWVEFFK